MLDGHGGFAVTHLQQFVIARDITDEPLLYTKPQTYTCQGPNGNTLTSGDKYKITRVYYEFNGATAIRVKKEQTQ
jgi:hypothetical protein